MDAKLIHELNILNGQKIRLLLVGPSEITGIISYEDGGTVKVRVEEEVVSDEAIRKYLDKTGLLGIVDVVRSMNSAEKRAEFVKVKIRNIEVVVGQIIGWELVEDQTDEEIITESPDGMWINLPGQPFHMRHGTAHRVVAGPDTVLSGVAAENIPPMVPCRWNKLTHRFHVQEGSRIL